MSATIRPPMPVLKTTLYDKVWSWLIAVVAGLVLAVLALATVYVSSLKPPPVVAVPVELLEMPGGDDNGLPDETLRVDSPDPERADATSAEIQSAETDISETLETVLELSETATETAARQFEAGVQNAGQKGSSRGSGRRGLGMGPGVGGISREQRWFIRFSDREGLDEYARQLGFFGIELAAIKPDGQVTILSKLGLGQPTVTVIKPDGGDQRLTMSWKAGERQKADRQLFERAGIKIGQDSRLMQVYPAATEDKLARLERDFNKLDAKQIKRTYFEVRSAGSGYEFVVTRQIPLEAKPRL